MVEYKFAHFKLVDPISSVLVILGKMLLLTSALNVTVSDGLSPRIIFPSKVITPVACRLPVTVVLLFNSMLPVPVAVRFISLLDTVFDTVSVANFKFAVVNCGTTMVGLLA